MEKLNRLFIPSESKIEFGSSAGTVVVSNRSWLVKAHGEY